MNGPLSLSWTGATLVGVNYTPSERDRLTEWKRESKDERLSDIDPIDYWSNLVEFCLLCAARGGEWERERERDTHTKWKSQFALSPPPPSPDMSALRNKTWDMKRRQTASKGTHTASYTFLSVCLFDSSLGRPRNASIHIHMVSWCDGDVTHWFN